MRTSLLEDQDIIFKPLNGDKFRNISSKALTLIKISNPLSLSHLHKCPKMRTGQLRPSPKIKLDFTPVGLGLTASHLLESFQGHGLGLTEGFCENYANRRVMKCKFSTSFQALCGVECRRIE